MFCLEALQDTWCCLCTPSRGSWPQAAPGEAGAVALGRGSTQAQRVLRFCPSPLFAGTGQNRVVQLPEEQVRIWVHIPWGLEP